MRQLMQVAWASLLKLLMESRIEMGMFFLGMPLGTAYTEIPQSEAGEFLVQSV